MTASDWLKIEIENLLDRCYGLNESQKAEHLFAFAVGQFIGANGRSDGIQKVCDLTNKLSLMAQQEGMP